jgi:hypothetical protein
LETTTAIDAAQATPPKPRIGTAKPRTLYDAPGSLEVAALSKTGENNIKSSAGDYCATPVEPAR